VFSQPEVDRLAAPLASALAQAGPDQDVTFAVTARPGGVPFVPRRATTGRVFAAQGSLHFIVGLLHAEFESQFLATGVLAPLTPGSQIGRGPTDWDIVPAPSGQVRVERADWVAIDLSAVRPGGPGHATGAPAFVPGPPDAATGPSTDPPGQGRSRQIEERLEALKRFREKGLITNEEYEQKRRSLLDEL
jgi:hypothetical protein